MYLADQEQKRSWWNNLSMPKQKKDVILHGPYRPHDTADHPVFGKPLSESLKYASVQISTANTYGNFYVWGSIPVVVAKCGLYLKEHATEVPGTFRVNGSNKRMRDLQAAFESPPRFGKSIDWKQETYTTHDVASVFRRYLTQMPEPVIPYDMYHHFRSALSKQPFNQEEVISSYKSLIRRMPKPNQNLLLYVLDLLSVFARKSDKNLMTAPNLAVIFRPGVISHPNHEMSPPEHALSQRVLEFLIAQQDWFMLDIASPAEPEGGPSRTDLNYGAGSGYGKWREGTGMPTKQGTGSSADSAATAVNANPSWSNNNSSTPPQPPGQPRNTVPDGTSSTAGPSNSKPGPSWHGHTTLKQSSLPPIGPLSPITSPWLAQSGQPSSSSAPTLPPRGSKPPPLHASTLGHVRYGSDPLAIRTSSPLGTGASDVDDVMVVPPSSSNPNLRQRAQKQPTSAHLYSSDDEESSHHIGGDSWKLVSPRYAALSTPANEGQGESSSGKPSAFTVLGGRKDKEKDRVGKMEKMEKQRIKEAKEREKQKRTIRRRTLDQSEFTSKDDQHVLSALQQQQQLEQQQQQQQEMTEWGDSATGGASVVRSRTLPSGSRRPGPGGGTGEGEEYDEEDSFDVRDSNFQNREQRERERDKDNSSRDTLNANTTANINAPLPATPPTRGKKLLKKSRPASGARAGTGTLSAPPSGFATQQQNTNPKLNWTLPALPPTVYES